MKKGWEIVPFGNVCEISGGSQPSKSNFIYEPREGYIRLVQVRDYRTDKFLTYIPKELAKKFCSKTDIMIGRYGPPIFGIFSGIEGAYNVALMKAIPNEKRINKEFFRWFLKTDKLVRFVEKTSKRAAGQDGVRKDRLYSYPTPIPPLPEQKQIVAILDEAFAAIDKAKANIEQNIVNTKELFQSKLNDIFSQTGDGWEEKTLGEVYDVRDGTHDSPKYIELGYPLITSKNLKDNSINYNKVKFISEKDLININKRSKVDVGDVLFAMIGTIGNPVVITETPNFAIKNVALFKVPNSQNSAFLRYYLESSIDTMLGEAKGTTQQFVGLGYLRKFSINIPSLERQIEIVEKLENVENNTINLEIAYLRKLDSLMELKKSILQKAFAGELTN